MPRRTQPIPDPPAGLDAQSAADWRELAELHRGAVAAATLVRLRALVDVLARQRAVRLSVDRDGLTVLGSTGQPRANPLLAEERLLREEADSRLREWRFSGGR